MKKSIVILLVIISIFVASCSPQVTVTSEVTVTLPAATQTPEPSATPTAAYTPTPAKETITTPKGVILELGAPVEGQEGAFVITSMTNGKDWMADINADTRLGFTPEDNQWVAIKNADGTTTVVLQRVSDNIQIAKLKPSGTVDWDFDQLINGGSESGSVLFNGAKIIARKDIISWLPSHISMLGKAIEGIPGDKSTFHSNTREIFSKDGLSVILVEFIPRGNNPDAGYVCLRGLDNKPIVFWTENFNLDLPLVTR